MHKNPQSNDRENRSRTLQNIRSARSDNDDRVESTNRKPELIVLRVFALTLSSGFNSFTPRNNYDSSALSPTLALTLGSKAAILRSQGVRTPSATA